MRKVTELTLDEQKKRNLILKELNALASKRDNISLARKQQLMASYISLMGITQADKTEWESWMKKIQAAKQAQRDEWARQRKIRRGLT